MTFELLVAMERAFRIFMIAVFIGIANYFHKATAQTEGGIVMLAEIIDGDTVPVKYLPYLNVIEEKRFISDYERRKWLTLQKNVKFVYPFAKLAGQLLEEYSDEMATATEKEKKKFYRKIEDEIKAKYGDTARNMTTTQGTILIKLIDRETDMSGYEIIKEFRGGFSAVFWQGIGKIFDQNLKTTYDPTGEDAQIEQIVLMIEAGII